MLRSTLQAILLSIIITFSAACTAWQPTKEVWKTTKGLWNTYVSPPASVDYEDKGDVSPEARALSEALMGVDAQLTRLERVMQNADKPPTQAWLTGLFAQFPWLTGFAGVKYDGAILGQEPPDSIKQLDFIPLLYEDKKQNSRALRADVQPSPLGAEVMLATPLYDGVDFLGIVVSYFDMRNLMKFSSRPEDIVVLCPGALLWPGKYDFAATPLAGVEWEKVVRESSAGSCTNSAGTFYYMVRYLGNMPMVFAVPSKGAFPDGNGSLEQGAAYFPQEREKLPPPDLPERKRDTEAMMRGFQPEPEPEPEPVPQPAPAMPEPSERHVIQQGSRESMLLKKRQAERRRIQERLLEEMPTPETGPDTGPTLQLIPDEAKPGLPGGRPSPFGPRGGGQTVPSEGGADSGGETPAAGGQDARTTDINAPSRTPGPDAPRLADGEAAPAPGATPAPATSPAPEAPARETTGINAPPRAPAEDEPRLADGEAVPAPGPEPQRPATLPGGRPSPFGPRN